MPRALTASRPHVWLESLGDWGWPGQGGARAEALPLPPSWVSPLPPRLEPALAPGTAGTGRRATRLTPRRLLLAVLLSALAVLSVALALQGRRGSERILPSSGASRPVAELPTLASAVQPLPALTGVSRDGAGSAIAHARFSSRALDRREGSFTVYLPPAYGVAPRRYPVLYLLHGTNQPATAFLGIGLQQSLDRLISRHTIPPLIAVMIEGARGANNWRDLGPSRRYESYVLEVQELVDRMLPTLASRSGRAVAGDSMGGFGAMNVVLKNPYRFAVVESWLGFFNNLDRVLQADRPVLSRLGLHAFLYGAQGDKITSASENRPFAALLRAAGATAHAAVYPGDHSLQTLQAHLEEMLVFAGRALFAAR